MRTISLILLLAAPVGAAPVQIAELYGRLGTLFPHVDPPMTVTFELENWEIATTVADLGRTFTAPSHLLAAFDAQWRREHNNDVDYSIHVGAVSNGLSPDWSQIFAGFDTGAHSAQAFVPQLGDGIAGYNLTSVELTIEKWFAVRSPSQTSEFAHRIRIFGEIIPEPATVALLLMTILAMGLFVRRR